MRVETCVLVLLFLRRRMQRFLNHRAACSTRKMKVAANGSASMKNHFVRYLRHMGHGTWYMVDRCSQAHGQRQTRARGGRRDVDTTSDEQGGAHGL